MRSIGEVSSCGGGEVSVAAGIPWVHAAGGERVETVTSGNYHNTYFLRESRCGNQVAG